MTEPAAPVVNLSKDGKPLKRADDVACREYPNGCRGSSAKADCDEEHLHPLDAKGCIHYGWGPKDAKLAAAFISKGSDPSCTSADPGGCAVTTWDMDTCTDPTAHPLDKEKCDKWRAKINGLA